MKFGLINLGSMTFNNLSVYYVNLLISNFRAPCLDFRVVSFNACV